MVTFASARFDFGTTFLKAMLQICYDVACNKVHRYPNITDGAKEAKSLLVWMFKYWAKNLFSTENDPEGVLLEVTIPKTANTANVLAMLFYFTKNKKAFKKKKNMIVFFLIKQNYYVYELYIASLWRMLLTINTSFLLVSVRTPTGTLK